MLEELFKNILDSDVVKKVTQNIGENEIINKVKESITGNDYAQKLQEGLKSGALLEKIKSGAQTAGREATKVSLECYQVMTAETTPTVDKVIIGAALAYQFMPNLMNRDNFGPILSLLDNAVTLAIAYNRVKTHVTPEIEEKVNLQLSEWFSDDKPEEPAAEDAPLAQTDAEEPFDDVH
ncbi:MAG: hypothetical protein J6Y05_07335 [Bacteroidales bacterium]|nr:hypothetical protein [Bacteroidales bacterium]